MTNQKRLLLKAIEHNWGLTGPGDWSEVQWNIFYDGTYEVVSFFRPSFEACKNAMERKEQPEFVKKKSTGELDNEVFFKLRETIKQKQWRDPSLEVYAFDGVAWEIESFREDGSIENTSGKLGYIYGHRVLETIVSLLPDDGNLYDSSAFIAFSSKE